MGYNHLSVATAKEFAVGLVRKRKTRYTRPTQKHYLTSFDCPLLRGLDTLMVHLCYTLLLNVLE
jgi:hypothetical protein